MQYVLSSFKQKKYKWQEKINYESFYNSIKQNEGQSFKQSRTQTCITVRASDDFEVDIIAHIYSTDVKSFLWSICGDPKLHGHQQGVVF